MRHCLHCGYRSARLALRTPDVANTNPDFIFDQLHKSLTNLPYLSGSSTLNPHHGYQSSSMPKTASSQARAPTPMARSGLVQASCPTTTGRSLCEPKASMSTLVFAPSRLLSAYLPMPPAYSALLPCIQLDAYTQAHEILSCCAMRSWCCGFPCHTPFFTLNIFLIAHIPMNFFHKFGA